MKRPAWSAAAIAAAVSACMAAGDTVSLEPLKDNTLFQTANASSGQGPLFAGRTGPDGGSVRQRALLKFDVAAAVPAGATITSASLTMRLTQTNTGPQTLSIYRVLADWGEGPTSNSFSGTGDVATAGDCTWLYRYYLVSLWTTPGGDFDPVQRTSTVVDQPVMDYTWPSTALTVSDVQSWLDDPAQNHGWMVRGNEAVPQTSKKFASDEAILPTHRPHLNIEYTLAPPPVCKADVDGDENVGIGDLLGVIGEWGACDAPCPTIACKQDMNDDCTVGIADLLYVIGEWGPCD